MSKVIIFDFDGVLADSFEVVFAMNKDAAAKINKTLTREEYASCFEEHINARMAQLFDLDEDEKQNFVDVKATLFPHYYNAQSVFLFDFAQELIVEMSKHGELWIVSSSPSELIESILESRGLKQYFTRIVGQNRQPKNLFFKTALIDKKEGEVFFITDTTGDIKEARKTGIPFKIIAVSWGFHKPDLLLKQNPDLLAKNSKEIINFMNH